MADDPYNHLTDKGITVDSYSFSCAFAVMRPVPLNRYWRFGLFESRLVLTYRSRSPKSIRTESLRCYRFIEATLIRSFSLHS
jgi:hypothetical protein